MCSEAAVAFTAARLEPQDDGVSAVAAIGSVKSTPQTAKTTRIFVPRNYRHRIEIDPVGLNLLLLDTCTIFAAQSRFGMRLAHPVEASHPLTKFHSS
jgi:hypothetical protein